MNFLTSAVGPKVDLRSFRVEILQGSGCLQKGQTSEYPINRRRGSQFIHSLHGDTVDGEWRYSELRDKAPRGRSLGFGASDELAIRFWANQTPAVVDRGHLRSRVPTL